LYQKKKREEEEGHDVGTREWWFDLFVVKKGPSGRGPEYVLFLWGKSWNVRASACSEVHCRLYLIRAGGAENQKTRRRLKGEPI